MVENISDVTISGIVFICNVYQLVWYIVISSLSMYQAVLNLWQTLSITLLCARRQSFFTVNELYCPLPTYQVVGVIEYSCKQRKGCMTLFTIKGNTNTPGVNGVSICKSTKIIYNGIK